MPGILRLNFHITLPPKYILQFSFFANVDSQPIACQLTSSGDGGGGVV